MPVIGVVEVLLMAVNTVPAASLLFATAWKSNCAPPSIVIPSALTWSALPFLVLSW